MFLLLDETLPLALKTLLVGHDARTVRDMGWLGLSNGVLLDAVERAGFDAMITADQDIRFQQSMAERRVRLVVLSSNHWQTIRHGAEHIRQALLRPDDGTYRVVPLEPPPLRRRPPPAR